MQNPRPRCEKIRHAHHYNQNWNKIYRLHTIVKTACSTGCWSPNKSNKSNKKHHPKWDQLHNFTTSNLAPDLVVGVEVAFILVVQAISKSCGHLVHHLSLIGVEAPESRLAGETPRETAVIFKGFKGTLMPENA